MNRTNIVVTENKKKNFSPSCNNVFKLLFKKLIQKGFKFKNFILFFKLLIVIKTFFIKKIKKRKRKFSSLWSIYNALKRITMNIALTELKIAGKSYIIPIPCSVKRQKANSIKILLKNVESRLELTFILKLFGELKDSFLKKSSSYKYKITQYELAMENKQYFRFLIKYVPLKKKGQRYKIKKSFSRIITIRNGLLFKKKFNFFYSSFLKSDIQKKNPFLISKVLLSFYWKYKLLKKNEMNKIIKDEK